MKHRAKGTQLRIAVLSDLHIDRDVDARSWDLARTAVAAALAQQPDHVVIAGDVFDRARAQDADRTTVKRHLARLGLWHRDRLTIVVSRAMPTSTRSPSSSGTCACGPPTRRRTRC